MNKPNLPDDWTVEQVAVARWNAGEHPYFSTDVAEQLTCGYGKCDNGSFEYPLYPAEEYLDKMKKKPKQTLWGSIINVSDQIDNARDEQQVFMKVVEEIGELAQEIAIHRGQSYKTAGPDGIIGEAIDAINALVDLIHIHAPKLTEEDAAKIAYTKQLKWLAAFQAQQARDVVIEEHDYATGDYNISLHESTSGASGWKDKVVEGTQK